jgi:arylsulfatase A-like enzyme
MTKRMSPSRRDFLRTAAVATGTALAGRVAQAENGAVRPQQQPNILMICSDQFRADFIGANGENPSTRTPHLDKLAARGTNFTCAVTNQPLCSPARASFLTGMQATRTSVWNLGPKLELDHSLPTIATELKKTGYSTNFIGKWHIASIERYGNGWVAPGPSRGGFDDLWEGANIPELSSHPMEGNYWINDGTNLGYKDVYRPDFLTSRAVSFVEQKHDKPWLLFLSQAEPHQQNDVDDFIAPPRYAKSYEDPFIPQDLRDLPGNWRSRIPGYYGCVQAIDDCVGNMVAALERTGQLDNTIIVFFSDHGCHFRTRMGEYKRAPHDAAIRVPMIFAGPGFDNAARLDEVVSLIDLTPTLLDGAGVTVPRDMQGHTLKSLVTDKAARQRWDSTAYVQISASMVGRAIRTRDWMYSCYDPAQGGDSVPLSRKYVDYAMYQVGADPYQKLNLIGRPEYAATANELRAELKRRIVANGEPEPEIAAMHYFV